MKDEVYMARLPKLKHSPIHNYYVQIQRKRHYLGTDKKAAERKYAALVAKFYKGELVNETDTLASVITQFIEYVDATAAPKTTEWYRDPLTRFVRYIGQKKKVSNASG